MRWKDESKVEDQRKSAARRVELRGAKMRRLDEMSRKEEGREARTLEVRT